MIRTFLQFISVLALCLPVFSVAAILPAGADEPLAPQPRHTRITDLVVKLASNYHYRKVALDDDLSASILEQYLEALDSNRSFFLERDIESAQARYGRKLDNALRSADIAPAFEIFKLYRQRVTERINWAVDLLSGEFDFTVNEDYIPDRDELPWATSATELNEIWRKRVKNDFLVLRLEEEEAEEEDRKTDAEIRKTLRKRYETTLRHVNQFTTDDICQIFLNSYAGAIGPHTSYLSPRNSENLLIHLSLSLEGIGAVLQSENEHTLVREIITGGPADKSGKLHADDRIVGVGQDRQGEMVDVVGWRLQDVVNLIRGPKGSVVRLKILPGESGLDGKTEEIMLVRNRIDLAERAASSSVVEITNDNKNFSIGVIELPTFYAKVRSSHEEGEENRSTTRDVRRLIEGLKKKSVDGIVLDLRGNSGGSLEEAVNMTGLFLTKGPVVQIKKSTGEFTIRRDKNPSIDWSGPLVVLVDKDSASASEIFAGAIQDYGRGLIVGETTHGKGTVQHLINLNDVARSGGASNKEDMGQFKLTIAQFFRVNGESTQYRGVLPDIVFPGITDPGEEGERELENALPWSEVLPARFSPHGSFTSSLDWLREEHERRMAADPVFDVLEKELTARKDVRNQTRFSLMEVWRRAERKSREKAHEEREERFRLAIGVEDETGTDEEDDSSKKSKEEKPESLVSEILLREAASVTVDIVNANRHRNPSLIAESKKAVR